MSPTPQKILAYLPNWLGDAAMCTPALRALRGRFPDAQLAVAGRQSVCDLLAGLSWLDSVIPIPSQPSLPQQLRLAGTLREPGRDIAVVFPHSFRAALLARFAGSQRRIGYARGRRSWLVTDPVEPHRQNGAITPVYMGKEYLDLVAHLGAEDDSKGLELAVDPTEAAAIRDQLPPDAPIVGIAPGAAFGPSKLWPAERFAAVADALHERVGAQALLITGPGEERARDAVLAAAKHPMLQVDAGHPSIARMKATISNLDLLIGNDSGTRHVAVAFKVPVVCIMGPTAPAYSEGPYERGEVLRVDVDCGPCQKPVCRTDHRCMTRISVERVTEAALKQLL